MDGEIGHDGEGGPVEEEEGALQGEQVHVRPEAATLKGALRENIRRLKMSISGKENQNKTINAPILNDYLIIIVHIIKYIISKEIT